MTVPVDRVDQPWKPITPTPRSRLASRALSTKPMMFQGVERSAHLVWERVGHD